MLKRLKLIQYCKDKIRSAGVIFLQKVHLDSKVEQKWKEDFSRQVSFSHEKPNSCGVLTAFFGTEMLIVLKNNRDEEGHILIFDIYGNDSEYILISLNANTEKEQIDLMDNLLELLEEFNTNKKSQLIVARGCNSFVDLKLDVQVGKITLKKKSLAKLVEFKEIY